MTSPETPKSIVIHRDPNREIYLNMSRGVFIKAQSEEDALELLRLWGYTELVPGEMDEYRHPEVGIETRQ